MPRAGSIVVMLPQWIKMVSGILQGVLRNSSSLPEGRTCKCSSSRRRRSGSVKACYEGFAGVVIGVCLMV